MPMRNTPDRYGSVAKTLHWLIFLLIAAMIAIGYIMTSMANGPDKLKLIGIHKSIGACILVLVVLRLLWKAINIAPPLPAALPAWEKLAAHGGHFVLYLLILAMPISGWAMSSASGFPVSVFGWFTLPDIAPHSKPLAHLFEEIHNTLAWVIIVMVSLHALAALWHHFYHHNNVLRRMLPW